MKSGLHLHVIHAVAYSHSWYGRWGYKFERGSYGNDQDDYNEALEALRACLWTAFVELYREFWTRRGAQRYAVVEEPRVPHDPKAAAAAAVQATDLQTIQDLFRHMLELLRSKHRAINRHRVVYDLTTFTAFFSERRFMLRTAMAARCQYVRHGLAVIVVFLGNAVHRERCVVCFAVKRAASSASTSATGLPLVCEAVLRSAYRDAGRCRPTYPCGFYTSGTETAGVRT